MQDHFSPSSEGSNSPKMFPFVISYDDLSSSINRNELLKAPAGRSGFVRIEDGHFATDEGRIRFFGTNLTGSASFSSCEYTDRLVERLATFGINCVRLHYFDADYTTFAMAPEHGIMAGNKHTRKPSSSKNRPIPSLQ